MKILFLFLILASACFAQCTGADNCVAHAAAAGNPTTNAVTSAVDTTGCTPHCMFVAYVAYTSCCQAAGIQVSDSCGNTAYQKVHSRSEDGDSAVNEWIIFAPTTCASTVWTGKIPGGNNGGVAIAVFAFKNITSGPDTGICSPYPACSSTSSNFNNPLSTAAITPTNNSEIVISANAWYGGCTQTINSPLTLVDRIAFSGGYTGNVGIADAYQVQTTSTTVTPTWNTGGCGGAVLVDTFFTISAPQALSVTTTNLSEGFVGQAYTANPYSTTVTAIGGIAPYTWSNTGTLPTGLSLGTGTGTLTGTPTVAATYGSLVFTVTDSASTMASSGSLTIVVAPTALSISTSPSTCPTGTQYAAYAGCTIIGAGGTGSLVYSWTSNSSNFASIPEGLSLNTSTGAIASSLIGAQGQYGTQFVITDSLGATASKTVTFGFHSVNGWAASILPSNSIFRHRMDFATTGLPVDTSPFAPNLYASGNHIKPFWGKGGAGNLPNGIPMIQVPFSQANATEQMMYPFDQYQPPCYFGIPATNVFSCPGSNLQAPLPSYMPLENTFTQCCNEGGSGNGDSHGLVYQQAGGGNPDSLWETYNALPCAYTPRGVFPACTGGATWAGAGNGLWTTLSGNVMTPQGQGSADAAGLPITPLLYTAEEVIGTGTPSAPNGVITHMGRFTVTHLLKYWVWPATATAGTGACAGVAPGNQLFQATPPASCNRLGPVAGEIYRIQASYTPPACMATSPQANIIFTALRNYGMIAADNGSSIGLIGTPSVDWNDSDLGCLNNIQGTAFEPVGVSSLIVSNTSFATNSGSIIPVTISTACPLPVGVVGVAYSQTLLGTSGSDVSARTWGITGSLPGGLSLTGAVISGTPTTAAPNSFSITVSNDAGAGVNSPLSCSLLINNTPPTNSQATGVGVMSAGASIH